MHRIAKVSYLFGLLFKSLFLLYPLMVVAYWMQWISLPDGYFLVSRLSGAAAVQLEDTRTLLRIGACAVDLIPTAAVMASFYYLIKLFQLYAENHIFSYKNIFYIRKIGLLFFYQVILGIMIQPILSLILTFDAPPGGHMISIGFSGDDLSSIIIAGIALLISWIMEEGKKLEEETALTV